MPRAPRAVLPEAAAYHVTCRGVAQQPIYGDDVDRRRFTVLLSLTARRWRWQVLAYCLMENHFHLVVTCDREQLSRGMHLLNFLYAQHFNRRHDRVGHLFQSRFDARVIDTDEYFVAACAYVLTNAERVGITDWPWRGGELLAEIGGHLDVLEEQLAGRTGP